IGPDMFFLMPDFKAGPLQSLWGASQYIKDLYTWWDDNFLAPWEETMGPIAANTADELGALSGGLTQQFGNIAKEAIAFLWDSFVVAISREYDLFSLLGSGVQDAYDEKTFFWSDMLHYRKTFEFGHFLFKKAQDSGDEALMAYALGWMTHLATDVTGHAFTNEKCGGPYRLHWQRHKLVENHMDAKVLDSEHGQDEIYNQIGNSAQHLWISFAYNDDGTAKYNFFDAQPGPDYPTGDKTPDILARRAAWDVDSDLPEELSAFLAAAFAEFFTDDHTGVASPTGASASHPTIIEDIQPGTHGYPDAAAIENTYWWLSKYVKFTTTDFYKIRRPELDVILTPPFPSPPYAGTNGGLHTPESALEWALAILAFLIWIAEVIVWAITYVISVLASLGTYLFRWIMYEFIEVPLYNAWLAVHFYLAQTAFVQPMKTEINPGLMTLGVAPADAWNAMQDALDDLSGGIGQPQPAGAEPSGRDRRRTVPKEVVVDTPETIWPNAGLRALFSSTGIPPGQNPSEFQRPWQYPALNEDGSLVATEPGQVQLSPYTAGTDATAMIAVTPGDNNARARFEAARSEQETLAIQADVLARNQNLGSPIDFAGYVIAKLTRDNPGPIPNFNLDSDRGYAYLCWDWLRSSAATAVPRGYHSPLPTGAGDHAYHPPLAAGYGWDPGDVTTPGTSIPAHNPKAPQPVRIRYIDREDKLA
ncbi:MAG: hypothetical protein QOI35_73, partial [Cryptosporangiaceae bacterium]|nr:hypothetical protein [Cryptosporangiaceae bacterium]